MKWPFAAALVTLAAVSFARPAVAAVDAYLQIDGVQGESKEHPGAIELKSWTFGTERGGQAPASSGRAVRGLAVSEITIEKTSDKSSPILMQASASGRRFKTMTLYARKAGGSQQPYLVYKLTNVLISHFQMSGGGEQPTERLTLNFAKIETNYHPQTEDNGVTRASMVPSASFIRPAAATADGYLQIEGISGESTDDRHKDWIEISSFNIGAHGGGGGGSGRGTGRPTAQEITVTKHQDAASPKLYQALHNGTHIPKVIIELSRPTGKPMVYELTDVMISSYQMGGGGDRPSESVTFSYGKLEVADQRQGVSEPQGPKTGGTTSGLTGVHGPVPRATHLPPPGDAN